MDFSSFLNVISIEKCGLRIFFSVINIITKEESNPRVVAKILRKGEQGSALLQNTYVFLVLLFLYPFLFYLRIIFHTLALYK